MFILSSGGVVMGFLKFLLAIGLVILGAFLTVGGVLSCANVNIMSSFIGSSTSETPFLIIGIVGIVVMLGGFYMLRKK